MTERMPPIPYADWDDEARQELPKHLARPELFESNGGDKPMPAILGFFARNLRVAVPWMTFSHTLSTDPLVEPALRELAVLRVCWRVRSGYLWTEHVRIGVQCGLSIDHAQAMKGGPDSPVFTPLERLVILAVDQMIDDGEIDDVTWRALAEHFSEPALFELLFVIGAFLGQSLVFNSVRLQPVPTTEVEVPPLPP